MSSSVALAELDEVDAVDVLAATSSATATESRVLPLPPGPVRVTSRGPSRLSSALRAASSASRPTSAVAATGRLPGAPRLRRGGNMAGRPGTTSW